MNLHDDAPSDLELLERARRGDERALGTVLARHQEVAFRVAIGVVGDPDRAADAVQEAFLKALRALDGFRGDARFRTWLLTIVVNEARGMIRRRGRRRETALDDVGPLADGGPAPDHVAECSDEAGRARACLEELPEKQRMAVRLRVEDGLSFKEIGEIIGSSEGSARVNYHYGIRRLRDLMEEGA